MARIDILHPECSGKMYAVSYDVALNVLKDRS